MTALFIPLDAWTNLKGNEIGAWSAEVRGKRVAFLLHDFTADFTNYYMPINEDALVIEYLNDCYEQRLNEAHALPIEVANLFGDEPIPKSFAVLQAWLDVVT